MNRVTDILETKYPVIQGAMGGISGSKLVAAVSEAGGLGVLHTSFDENGLKKEIKRTQNLTSKPFAINFPIARRKHIHRFMEIAIDAGVDIFSVSAGNPKPFLDKIEEARVSMQVVPSARLAKKMEDYGFDLVVAAGRESGGLVPSRGPSTLSLIPNAVERVDIPIVAAGGIADEKTAIAVKKLGAEGVQMGTRFMASEECDIHHKVKDLMVKGTEDEIVSLSYGKITANVVENGYVRKLLERLQGDSDTERSEETELDRRRIGMKEGDLENGLIIAGQAIGRIKEVKSAEELVKQIGEAFLSSS